MKTNFLVFHTITWSVWVKATELAVHTLLVLFAVVAKLMLVTTNKKLVNDVVVLC